MSGQFTSKNKGCPLLFNYLQQNSLKKFELQRMKFKEKHKKREINNLTFP